MIQSHIVITEVTAREESSHISGNGHYKCLEGRGRVEDITRFFLGTWPVANPSLGATETC